MTLTWNAQRNSPENATILLVINQWWIGLNGVEIIWKQRLLPADDQPDWRAQRFDETFVCRTPDFRGITFYWNKDNSSRTHNITARKLEFDPLTQRLVMYPNSSADLVIAVAVTEQALHERRAHQPQPVALHDRYEVTKVLGKGDVSTTYLAIDWQTRQPCAIKCLSLQQVDDWQTWDLFEREARILQTLHHPQIPDYIDFFRHDTDNPHNTHGDARCYLVQQFIPGDSLADKIRERHSFSEKAAIHLIHEILGVLEYLHRFTPPMIHQDIKPGNIVIDLDERPCLIDFGFVTYKAVTDVYGALSTSITFDIMPPEQRDGHPVPASDIYALGLCVVCALAGTTDPAALPWRADRVDVRKSVNVSRDFAKILHKMLAPDWHDRHQTASGLRQVLQKKLMHSA